VAADDTSQTSQLRASLQELHRQLTASGAEPGSDDYARSAEDILDAAEHLLTAEAAATAPRRRTSSAPSAP
jgi:hypothetical protein